MKEEIVRLEKITEYSYRYEGMKMLLLMAIILGILAIMIDWLIEKPIASATYILVVVIILWNNLLSEYKEIKWRIIREEEKK